jgi:hypothetical protein
VNATSRGLLIEIIACPDMAGVATDKKVTTVPDQVTTASGQNKGKRRSLTRQNTIDVDEATTMIEACRLQPIAASRFHDSSLLLTLASQHSANFKTLLPAAKYDGVLSSAGELTWGSLCSGSEGVHFVIEALNSHFGQERINDVDRNLEALYLRQAFACEIVPNKRKWIDALVNDKRRPLGLPLMCIFVDIRTMGGALSECSVHGCKCLVPDCDILVASTSCKDLSKLSSSRFRAPVLSQSQSPGGSAATFRGLLSYMDAHKVELLVYENSDNLDDAYQKRL